MPHVSSKKLDNKFSSKLFGKLLGILGRAQNGNVLPFVADELFTDTEKIMLAKRIAAILMLDNDIPQQKITEMLLMSPSTISKISLKIELGKYDSILKISKQEKTDMKKLVCDLLTVGGIMPPKVGRRYWLKNL